MSEHLKVKGTINTDKTSIINEDQKSCLGNVGGISKLYLFDLKDCIFENGVLVRMKKKYGKFKRVVHVIDCNNH